MSIWGVCDNIFEKFCSADFFKCAVHLSREGPEGDQNQSRNMAFLGPPTTFAPPLWKNLPNICFLKVLKHLPQTTFCVRVQFQHIPPSSFAYRPSTRPKTPKNGKKRLILAPDLATVDYSGWFTRSNHIWPDFGPGRFFDFFLDFPTVCSQIYSVKVAENFVGYS